VKAEGELNWPCTREVRGRWIVEQPGTASACTRTGGPARGRLPDPGGALV